jgi:hypothetical protein
MAAGVAVAVVVAGVVVTAVAAATDNVAPGLIGA